MVKRPVVSPSRMKDVLSELKRLGIACFGWSTWSSTSMWQRFRVVVPFATTVNPESWGQCTEWLLEASGMNKWRGCIDLPVLRDTARLHFLPARRPGGSPVERFEVPGEILTPLEPEVLALIIPPKLALQPWQVEAQAKRERQGLTARSGKGAWACRFKASDGTPLDLRTLDAVRLLEAMGCRVGTGKAWGAGAKHRTSCPWFLEHSHRLDDDSGVLFLEPDRWPSWHCSHSHHAHLGLADLLETAGVLQ